jgi:competence protein ComEC
MRYNCRMVAWLRSLLRQPRRPLAGIALGAIAGILLGERIWLAAGGGGQLANATLIVAFALFAGAVSLFFCRQRPWLFWMVVGGGFATLHLFQSSVVPAIVLSRVLTSAGGQNPANLQICQAIGTIADEPRGAAKPPMDAAGADWHFTFQLESISVAGFQWPCHAQVAAFWKNAAAKPVPGDRLSVSGLAGNVAGPRNPGEFDDAAYLRRRGIYSELTMNGIADVLPAPPDAWLRPIFGQAMQRVHDWIDATLRLDLQDDPDVSRMVTTILLGLRDNPGLGDLEPIFQRTGTLHFFAIDGLKIGFLGWLLLAALTSCGLSRKWARAFCLLLLLGYALAAGIGPATVRAVAVAAVLLGGEWLDRPARAGNTLGAAAAGLLLFDTNQLFTLGFQLSFLVVLAILTLAGPLRDWLWKFGAPDPFLPRLLFSRGLRLREAVRRALVNLTGVSMAAWAGSLPLTILAFHLVSPISILANVTVFPLAAAMFGLAVFSVLGAIVWQTWAVWMNNANWLVAKTLLGTLRLFDAVPGGSFYVASPGFWHWPAPAAEVTVLDLGPGRAMAVRTGGADWLIDTGRAGDCRAIVLPFTLAAGIGRLDGLLLTQGDAYHLAGAPLAIEDLQPARVLLAPLPGRSPALREVRALLAARHQSAESAVSGTVVGLAPRVTLRVLYPPADLAPGAAAAGRAVIVRIDADGWRILLLGDGNADSHRWLTAHLPPAELRSDVVVIGQPDEPEFLGSIHPRLLILERARAGAAAPPRNGPWTTVSQSEAGAVTLRAYPNRLEASGFVNGKLTTIEPVR